LSRGELCSDEAFFSGMGMPGLAGLVVGMFWAGCAASGPDAVEVPPEVAFVQGSWEAADPGNNWQMNVAWQQPGLLEGVLVRNGTRSACVGFSVDDVVWRAIPTGVPGTLREEQLWRTGSNGVTVASEWRPGTVKLAESDCRNLITTTTTFARIPLQPEASPLKPDHQVTSPR
jgi:hypothetical protein